MQGTHIRTPVLNLSDRVYRGLLAAYPASFRQRYGPEMAQVFRTCCRSTYLVSGKAGLLRLWLPTLWDWALTVAHERFSSIFRRSSMNETTPFDRQLGDLVWSLATGLLAGYSLRQVIEAIATNAPEPTASAFKRLDADLKTGFSLDEGLANLKKSVPSEHLGKVIAVIQEQQKTGGNLALMLEPLSRELVEQAGSDGAFYPAMRQEAEALGAQVPERARV
jgi:Flp pilus assembly protein TadB